MRRSVMRATLARIQRQRETVYCKSEKEQKGREEEKDRQTDEGHLTAVSTAGDLVASRSRAPSQAEGGGSRRRGSEDRTGLVGTGQRTGTLCLGCSFSTSIWMWPRGLARCPVSLRGDYRCVTDTRRCSTFMSNYEWNWEPRTESLPSTAGSDGV